MPGFDLLKEFPPHTLREYALLADGERGAVIGPRGDIAWLCVPAWDSGAVFSTLIGGAGCYAVTPRDRYSWGGYYDRRSLVWNSRWITTAGIVESREALALPAEPGTAVILRRITALDAPAKLRVVLEVRAGYGTEVMHTSRGDSVWTGRSGPVRFRWSGAAGAHRAGRGPLVAEIDVDPGEQRDLILELSTGELPDDPPQADPAWSATEATWQRLVPELPDGVLGPRDAETAMAVLTGLTASGGGMVAAATMSLPERAWTSRNYDYRYAWIRDQCFAGRAVAAHGHFGLLDTAVRFVAERVLEDGPQLRPAYTARGGPVPKEERLTHLQGYPGGTDRVGNWVNQQFQLDTLGEALELFAAASWHDRLDTGHWDAVEAAVAAIEARAGDPDAGIWELGDDRWTHSRLTCVSGLRAVAGRAPSAQSGRWAALADAILAQAASECVHRDGYWQRTPEDGRVDGALLLPLVRNGLPVDDPRSVATIEAVGDQLRSDHYVYRFRHDPRPLGEAEGAFLLCGFVLALAEQRRGNHLEARALFERNRSACGSPGLLSEEFDVEQRQLRGNLPQAFVHALLLECASSLAEPSGPGRAR